MPTDALPDRARDSHKGDHGHVLVVGGTAEYVNTPGIVAMGALRTGVDLVTVAAPQDAATAAARGALNVMLRPLDGDHLGPRHVETVLAAAERADCVVVGNGCGRAADTMDAVADLLTALDDTAVVVDADAIHALTAADVSAGAEGIFTPHSSEYEALAGEPAPSDLDARTDAVRAAAADLGGTVLLKGPTDVVSDGDAVEAVEAGTPQMTRGGTGDVLAGVVAGHVAQGMEAFPAAVRGAAVNGAAGEAAVEQYGAGFLLEELLREVSRLV